MRPLFPSPLARRQLIRLERLEAWRSTGPPVQLTADPERLILLILPL